MCTNFWINPHNGKLPSRLAPAQCQNSLAPHLLSNIYWSKTKTSISLNRVYWYDTMCHIYFLFYQVLWWFQLLRLRIVPVNRKFTYDMILKMFTTHATKFTFILRGVTQTTKYHYFVSQKCFWQEPMFFSHFWGLHVIYQIVMNTNYRKYKIGLSRWSDPAFNFHYNAHA